MGEASGTARRARDLHWLLTLPALLTLLLVFAAPFVILVAISFLTQDPTQPYGPPLTLANYEEAIATPLHWRVVLNTFRISLVTTALTVLLGFPVAAHIARSSGRRRTLYLTLVLAPLLVGIVVRTYAWTLILSDTGLVNQFLGAMGFPAMKLMYNEFGIVVGLVHILLPYMVLTLNASLENIDPDLTRAARSLGATSWSVFWCITWPLALPGLVSGTVLVFVLAMSAYATPSLLGGFSFLVMPLLVVQQVTVIFDWPQGSALALFFFLLTLLTITAYMRLLRRSVDKAR